LPFGAQVISTDVRTGIPSTAGGVLHHLRVKKTLIRVGLLRGGNSWRQGSGRRHIADKSSLWRDRTLLTRSVIPHRRFKLLDVSRR